MRLFQLGPARRRITARRITLTLLTIVMFSTALATAGVHGQATAKAEKFSTNERDFECSEPKDLHTVVVVDDSGSMNENDPNDLRIKSLSRAISQLPGSSEVSIVSFSSGAETLLSGQVNSLRNDRRYDEIRKRNVGVGFDGPHLKFSNGVDTRLRGRLDLDGYLEQGFRSDGGTNFPAALDKALEEADGKRNVLIFLSDGANNGGDFTNQLKKVHDKFKASFAIGLGATVAEQMELIARSAGGSFRIPRVKGKSGRYVAVGGADRLTQVFADVATAGLCSKFIDRGTVELKPGKWKEIQFEIGKNSAKTLKLTASWAGGDVALCAQRPNGNPVLLRDWQFRSASNESGPCRSARDIVSQMENGLGYNISRFSPPTPGTWSVWIHASPDGGSVKAQVDYSLVLENGEQVDPKLRLLTPGADAQVPGGSVVFDWSGSTTIGYKLVIDGRVREEVAQAPFEVDALSKGKHRWTVKAAGIRTPKARVFTVIADHLSPKKELEFARAVRPHLFFDSADRWRPVQASAFLKEPHGATGAKSHQFCMINKVARKGIKDRFKRACERVKNTGSIRAITPDVVEATMQKLYEESWKDKDGESEDADSWTSVKRRALWRDSFGLQALDFAGEKKDGEEHRSPRARDVNGTIPACEAPDKSALYDCDEVGKSPIYYRLSYRRSYWYFDYWWFMRFNNLPLALDKDAGCNGKTFRLNHTLCFDHEGDWEGATVVRDGKPDGGVAYVSISSHEDLPVRYLPRVIEYAKSDRKSRNHPYVYVANGTHAGYPRPCTTTYGLCLQTDASNNKLKQEDQDVKTLPDARYDGEASWSGNGRCNSCVEAFPLVAGAPSSVETKLGGSNTGLANLWAAWPLNWGARAENCLVNEKDGGSDNATCLNKGPVSPGLAERFARPWIVRNSERDCFLGYKRSCDNPLNVFGEDLAEQPGVESEQQSSAFKDAENWAFGASASSKDAKKKLTKERSAALVASASEFAQSAARRTFVDVDGNRQEVEPGSEEDCNGWQGIATTVVACDPSRLSLSVRGHELTARGDVELGRASGTQEVGKAVSGSAPGIAQMVGAPMADGETVTVEGKMGAQARIITNALDKGSVRKFEFTDVGLAAGGTARVNTFRRADGTLTASLARPDGSSVLPLSDRARPAAVTALWIDVRQRQYVARFRATSDSALVQVLGMDGTTILKYLQRDTIPGTEYGIEVPNLHNARSIQVYSVTIDGLTSKPRKARLPKIASKSPHDFTFAPETNEDGSPSQCAYAIIGRRYQLLATAPTPPDERHAGMAAAVFNNSARALVGAPCLGGSDGAQ